VKKERNVFPFSAIKGQDEMKLGLLLNIIEPEIKGLLVFGDRGTGKSTTIRALVDLLPKIEVIKNDPFNTDPSNLEPDKREGIETEYIKTPMVDLPLGATEDRLCGSINLEQAMNAGTKAFEAGLLAKANRGILYVDEVNLLDDHLIDILLDAAASGRNIIERDGVSVKHESRFILVGSGNPEEGEVRPQLLDRFGLYSEIKTVKDADIRVQIVESRMQFDENPKQWMKTYEEKQDEVKTSIAKAKELLPNVTIDRDIRVKISEICSMLDVDGLRGDLVVNRSAKAYAALKGDHSVTVEHIKKIISLCLRHRLRKDPLDLIDTSQRVENAFNQVFNI
jgi:magnesium chelatase subunit I